MTTLLMTELDSMAIDVNGNVIPAPQLPAVTRQVITYTAGSAAGTATATDDKTKLVYFHALDGAAYIRASAGALTTNFDYTLPSGGTAVVGAKPGTVFSVI